MKKLVFILIFLLTSIFVSYGGGGCGSKKINPIPSFGVQIENTGAFYELNTSPPTRNKRQMNVRTTSISPKIMVFPVTIWLVTDQGATTMGPYVIEVGETLSVPIDNRKWGAIVESDYPVLVDIWIGDDPFAY